MGTLPVVVSTILLAKPNNLKNMIPEMIPGIVILAMMLVGGIWNDRIEKRKWNGGICAASEKPWKWFDYDSQGGRGYTDGAGSYLWISSKADSSANAQGLP